MQEHEVVAAIVAGDPSGLTEALDRYAESLFAGCQSLLPEAEAAEVVTDTFIIAREKLAGLRDPARLGAWLEAVARNECHRRLIAGGETPGDRAAGAAALPEGLTGRILKVCTDETATGRADRATVAHLAGQFGHDGFPKPVSVPRQLRPAGRRRTPRLLIVAGTIAAAIALVAAVVVIAGSGGSHPGQTATAADATSPLADGGTTTSGAPGVEPTASVPASTRAARTATRKSSSRHGSSSQPKQGDPTPSAKPTPAQSAPAQPPAPPASSPPPATTKPTAPAAGVLQVSPGSITIVSPNDRPGQASIMVTASGGPVSGLSASVSEPNDHILITSVPGSLGSGQQAQLLVTAWGRNSFTATIILSPGDLTITLSLKATK
jgi:hypothetical protein